MRVVKWWFFSLWTFNMRNTRESNINISLWLQKYPRVKNSNLSVYPSRSYFKLCFAFWETPLCLAFSLVGNVQKCWGLICLFIAWISYWRNFSELRWCKTQKMRCWVFGERCQKLPALSELNRPQQSKRQEHSATLKKHILSSRRGLLGDMPFCQGRQGLSRPSSSTCQCCSEPPAPVSFLVMGCWVHR